MKVVINACYGGASLSAAAIERLAAEGFAPAQKAVELHKNRDPNGPRASGLFSNIFMHLDNEDRADKRVVKVIEEMGNDANGRFAQLQIVEVPDDVEWTIKEYDGIEWAAEKHRTWPSQD